MEASGLSASGGLARRVKIDEKKDHHPIYHLGNMYGDMMLYIRAFFLY
jgi:hypothetical protein